MLQVLEERRDHGRAELGEVHCCWGLGGLFVDKADQEPERVPVGRHRVWAGVTLGQEPVCEETLQ